MHRSLYVAFLISFLAVFQSRAGNQNTLLTLKAEKCYRQIEGTSKPSFKVFEKAITGYLHLKAAGKLKKEVLTIVDFSKSSISLVILPPAVFSATILGVFKQTHLVYCASARETTARKTVHHSYRRLLILYRKIIKFIRRRLL